MFARSLTDQALWDAIMANPDDDAPRLVYADALQQRGEPLGDLIAIQCNPRYASDQAMRAHAADLVHANAERWKAELGLAASARVEYQRGLPYLTHVQTRLAELAILDRAPVEFVCFTDHDASVETARGLARDARLARIRALSISCSGPALRELLASPHAALRRLFVGNCTNDAARAVAEARCPGSRAS